MGFGERTYRAEAFLPVPVERAFAILVDLPRYGEWNRFTTKVESTLVPGDPVVMRVDLGWITVRTTERIREVVEPVRIVWHIPSPLPWLLHAERVQTLTEAPGGCTYVTEDTIGGLIGPLVHLLFANGLERGFSTVATGLAAYASRGDT